MIGNVRVKKKFRTSDELKIGCIQLEWEKRETERQQ
jgi:hypothetical protein